jgi:hypothetical protein
MDKSKEATLPERQFLQQRKDILHAVISIVVLLAMMALFFLYG